MYLSMSGISKRIPLSHVTQDHLDITTVPFIYELKYLCVSFISSVCCIKICNT